MLSLAPLAPRNAWETYSIRWYALAAWQVAQVCMAALGCSQALLSPLRYTKELHALQCSMLQLRKFVIPCIP